MAQTDHHPDDEEYVLFDVPVDFATLRWLCEIADANHQEPKEVMAALLKETRIDDEAEHGIEHLESLANAPTSQANN